MLLCDDGILEHPSHKIVASVVCFPIRSHTVSHCFVRFSGQQCAIFRIVVLAYLAIEGDFVDVEPLHLTAVVQNL